VPDWLVALDDYMCARFLRCVLCGAPGGVMELRTVGDGAMSLTVCRHCYDNDPDGQRRQQWVTQHARTQESMRA
jgi:hypothetical protein